MDAYIRVSNNTGTCIIRAYTCRPFVRPSFPCEIKTDRFIVIIVTQIFLICLSFNSPLMHVRSRANLPRERAWILRKYQYITQMIRIKRKYSAVITGSSHLFFSSLVAVILFFFFFFL